MAIKQLILWSILAYGLGAVVIVALSILPIVFVARCAFSVLPGHRLTVIEPDRRRV